MTDRPKTAQDFQQALTDREQELILLRETVWNFLDTKHSSKLTAQFQADVRKADIAVGKIRHALLAKDNPQDVKIVSIALRQRCRELSSYTHEIATALADDFSYLHAAEDKAKIDVVKNTTFFIAIPGAFLGAVKAGAFDGVLTLNEAIAAGFGVSGAVLARKKIFSAFKAVAKATIPTCQDVRESPILFYVRESARQKARAASRALKVFAA